MACAADPAAAPESRGHQPCHPGKATSPLVPQPPVTSPGQASHLPLARVSGGFQHRRRAGGRGGGGTAGWRLGWWSGTPLSPRWPRDARGSRPSPQPARHEAGGRRGRYFPVQPHRPV